MSETVQSFNTYVLGPLVQSWWVLEVPTVGRSYFAVELKALNFQLGLHCFCMTDLLDCILRRCHSSGSHDTRQRTSFAWVQFLSL